MIQYILLKTRSIATYLSIILLTITCGTNEKKISFSFAFITDSHLSSNLINIRDNEIPVNRDSLIDVPFIGYERALQEIKERSIDFIVTGGDNIDFMTYQLPPIDGKLPVSDDILVVKKYVERMKKIEKAIELPIFHTIGNHDCYVYPPAQIQDPLHGQGFFSEYFSPEDKPYYSFDKHGWHFIILSTHDGKAVKNPNMVGVSTEQLDWLKNDLRILDPETPIILSAHAPFPIDKGYENVREDIYQIIRNNNVKLALFGHWHTYHEFIWHDIPCVIGSSLSGAVWSLVRNVYDVDLGGIGKGTDQGYLIVTVDGKDISWKHYPFTYSIEKHLYEKTGRRHAPHYPNPNLKIQK